MIAGSDRFSFVARFDGPDDVAESSVAAEASFGALRQSRRFWPILPGGFAV
jgi:hypothetical protein